MRKVLPLLFVLAGIVGCSSKSTSGTTCGDGVVDPGEECDSGTNGSTCQSLGYYAGAGTPQCRPNCTWDTSGCGGRCGDGVRQPEREECDQTVPDGQTCQSLGYHGGTIACSSSCELDLASCESAGRCGDESVQTGYGEVCDGANLGGQTCESLGYYGGTLACHPNCTAFDVTGCAAAGRCGDGNVQTEQGEMCDSSNLSGQTCESLGYYGGVLSCLPDCSSFNEVDCATVGRCGDGTVQPIYGENCDGANLDAQTCQTLGYYGGTLSCLPDCSFDRTSCEAAGRCGDGILQSSEECDGNNLAGRTCESLGWYPGTLSCLSCHLDASACGGRCGDGLVQSIYEECDGANLNGQTCRSVSYFTGSLSCQADCQNEVSGCLNILQIAAGAYHSCVVLTDGTMRCWGKNDFGQLGDNTTTNRLSPVAVVGISMAAKVTAGQSHTCALLTDGTVRCWGRNHYGQLGDNTTTNRLLPVAVSTLVSVVSVGAGESHTCAVKTDGTARCWGYNGYGQLGDGSTTSRSLPVAVSGLSGASSIVVGGNFTCALRTDKKVSCWGYNGYGQLGDGTVTHRHVPVEVSSLVDVNSLAAGKNHACATTSTSTLPIAKGAYCWGQNSYGQVGDGTTSLRSTPTPINHVLASMQNYKIYAGGDHACLISYQTSIYYNVYCWGRNTNGQLSDGTTTQQNSPVDTGMVGSLHALGSEHSCHTTPEQNLMRCWGSNANGQLGDGTTTGSLTYVFVAP